MTNAYNLTCRELAVLGLLGIGMSDRQIAARLNVDATEATSHILTLIRKMGVGSRTEAAVRAFKEQLLPFDFLEDASEPIYPWVKVAGHRY
jgi:DNA-binding NarL/FixJ family response regulator